MAVVFDAYLSNLTQNLDLGGVGEGMAVAVESGV